MLKVRTTPTYPWYGTDARRGRHQSRRPPKLKVCTHECCGMCMERLCTFFRSHGKVVNFTPFLFSRLLLVSRLVSLCRPLASPRCGGRAVSSRWRPDPRTWGRTTGGSRRRGRRGNKRPGKTGSAGSGRRGRRPSRTAPYPASRPNGPRGSRKGSRGGRFRRPASRPHHCAEPAPSCAWAQISARGNE